MSNVSKSTLTKWAIVIALTAICLIIPEQGIYTYEVKVFLAVTVFGLGLAAFELVHTMFISVVMPAAWVLFKAAPASVVMSPWVGTTFLMIMGALFMAATLEGSGFLQRVAYILMCKVKGSYLALLLAVFFTGIVINILTSGRAYLIMAPLCLGLWMSFGGNDKNLGCGLAAAVMVGSCQSHTYTFQATAWAVIYKQAEGYITSSDVTALSILMHNAPMIIVGLVTIFIVSKWFKPTTDLTTISYFEDKLAEMGKMTKREKTNAGMLAILLVFIFTAGWHKIDVNLGFALIPWLVFIPGLDGADEDTLKKYSWSTIFFVAACMSIGTVAASLGVGQVISEVSKDIIMNAGGSMVAVIVLIFAITFVLNFLMTPMAIMALITAPMCALAVELGFDPLAFLYAINNSIEAILLPYEYVPYLIVFGFGMMNMADFIKFSVMRCAIFLLGMIVLLIPYWTLIGIL